MRTWPGLPESTRVVDHAIRRVRVQPVDALASRSDRTLRALRDLRTGDPDTAGERPRLTVVVNLQVGVDVVRELLAQAALNSVDRRCTGRARRRDRGALLNRHSLEADLRAGRGG